ncbi:MAG: Fic family protein [ANME-2 cluster archaeon]|nr:Fic family protein [ANME-2 cluster archaeon]
MIVYKLNRERDIFRQAALFLHAIAAQHPFFDGNKEQPLQQQKMCSERQDII